MKPIFVPIIALVFLIQGCFELATSPESKESSVKSKDVEQVTEDDSPKGLKHRVEILESLVKRLASGITTQTEVYNVLTVNIIELQEENTEIRSQLYILQNQLDITQLGLEGSVKRLWLYDKNGIRKFPIIDYNHNGQIASVLFKDKLVGFYQLTDGALGYYPSLVSSYVEMDVTPYVSADIKYTNTDCIGVKYWDTFRYGEAKLTPEYLTGFVGPTVVLTNQIVNSRLYYTVSNKTWTCQNGTYTAPVLYEMPSEVTLPVSEVTLEAPLFVAE